MSKPCMQKSPHFVKSSFMYMSCKRKDKNVWCKLETASKITRKIKVSHHSFSRMLHLQVGIQGMHSVGQLEIFLAGGTLVHIWNPSPAAGWLASPVSHTVKPRLELRDQLLALKPFYINSKPNLINRSTVQKHSQGRCSGHQTCVSAIKNSH